MVCSRTWSKWRAAKEHPFSYISYAVQTVRRRREVTTSAFCGYIVVTSPMLGNTRARRRIALVTLRTALSSQVWNSRVYSKLLEEASSQKSAKTHAGNVFVTFCDLDLLTFWPPNKRIFRTHLGTFLAYVKFGDPSCFSVIVLLKR